MNEKRKKIIEERKKEKKATMTPSILGNAYLLNKREIYEH